MPEAALRQTEGFLRGLLVRHGTSEPDELAYYTVFAPAEATLETLARVAGARWSVERGFEDAKQEAGLDEYEVRSWRGWHRHVTLALLAHAFLAVVRAHAGPSADASAPGVEKGGLGAVRTRPLASTGETQSRMARGSGRTSSR